MTGFYSKDFILESAYGQFYFSGTVVTACYYRFHKHYFILS
jgi:hypothetical protein